MKKVLGLVVLIGAVFAVAAHGNELNDTVSSLAGKSRLSAHLRGEIGTELDSPEFNLPQQFENESDAARKLAARQQISKHCSLKTMAESVPAENSPGMITALADLWGATVTLIRMVASSRYLMLIVMATVAVSSVLRGVCGRLTAA